MVKIREVNILEMAGGAILEQINNEANKIMANIIDPNTVPTVARKLTVTLTFKPNEDRQITQTTAQAKSTLAPVKSIVTSIFVEEDNNGKPKARELTKSDPNQESMFVEPEVNVLKLVNN